MRCPSCGSDNVVCTQEGILKSSYRCENSECNAFFKESTGLGKGLKTAQYAAVVGGVLIGLPLPGPDEMGDV